MGNVSVRMGTQGAAHPTSEVSSRVPGSTQVYLHPLGTVGFDSAGNEYVYVEYGAQVYGGVWVGITAAYTAVAVLTTTFRGPVGIAMGAGASDTAGWVLVRGTHATAQMAAGSNSGATSSYNLAVASSVSTPAAGANAVNLQQSSDEEQWIYGAWITGAGTTPTSATSVTGGAVPVRLNYPYVSGYTDHKST